MKRWKNKRLNLWVAKRGSAVAKVEEKRIKLDIEYSRESLFIQVENTFDGVVKYDNNTDDKRISTRKDGDEHGHDLKNIRKSVEKYNGHIDLTHEENIFSVGALLYVDEVTPQKIEASIRWLQN
ncbi:MAG: GHKL domain-containing protein [Defluviitaleaceae bacterium]|nr:GHKL domain-containing protein [Defluviitaleaceae bacterium]MCL2274744.1 GHKL domain-containing protein [Defluviitaleaceae bacterium]